MIYLDRSKLDSLLNEKGLSLAALAREAGVSRQSLYRFLRGDSVLSTPFQKILKVLEVDVGAITQGEGLGQTLLQKAPFPIQRVARRLVEFSKQTDSVLILFGSRAAGKLGPSFDWDFGLLLPEDHPKALRRFRILRQELTEKAFPYRVDIVCLNDAPMWFIESVVRQFVCLYGEVSARKLRERVAA